MSINQTLLELSPKWPTYRQTMTELSAGPNPICTSDTDFGGTFYQTFLSTLVDDFKDFGVIDEKDFSIKASLGEGRLATIPWLCIFHNKVTKFVKNQPSAKEGFYISYLFDKNFKYFYTSFTIASTQCAVEFGESRSGLAQLAESANKFRSYFQTYVNQVFLNDTFTSQMTLTGNDSNRWSSATSYEHGASFSKRYVISELSQPENVNAIKNDLIKYLTVFSNIVSDDRSTLFSPSSDIPNERKIWDVLSESTSNNEIVWEDLDYNQPEHYTFPELEDSEESAKTRNRNASSRRNPPKEPPQKVGRLGEEFVFRSEQEKLKSIGKHELANQIHKQYLDQINFPGYDIQSFDENGDKIFIEVKSTSSTKMTNFVISSNEWEAAEKHGDAYYIYTVTNCKPHRTGRDSKPRHDQIFRNPAQLARESSDSFVRTSIQYKVDYKV